MTRMRAFGSVACLATVLTAVAATPGFAGDDEPRANRISIEYIPPTNPAHMVLYDRLKQRHALEMLQEACSDLGSRLFMRVREQLGLAYYVGAQHFPGMVPGYFAFYTGTMPEKVDLVEKELLLEAELLGRAPVLGPAYQRDLVPVRVELHLTRQRETQQPRSAGERK